MIQKIWEKPVTVDSTPFSTAVERCDLAAHGYEEKEFFFSGTANLYGTAEDGHPQVLYSNCPYTNRFIMRRPKDPARSNGHVVLEIINATGHYDIERMWIISSRYYMAHGVTYIGLTSKPDVFDSLVEWDQTRYAELSWSNPRPMSEWKDSIMVGNMKAFVRKDQECGLYWDMLTDLPDVLRQSTPMNPLRELNVKYITLTGWSQSSCYLTRFVNSFAYRVHRGRPVYDGYFNAGCVFTLPIPLNQEEYGHRTCENTVPSHMEQPFYMVQTESENGTFGCLNVPRQDCDEPGRLCRIWEIAGATHDNRRGLIDYYAGDRPIPSVDYPATYLGKHDRPNDFPYEYPMNAAWDHLFRWIETGEAPRPAPRFRHDAAGHNVTDVLGNAIGGVRTAFVDLPTRRYIPWSLELRDGQEGISSLFGHEEMFSSAFLQELYGSLIDYEARVRSITFSHVTEGFVLREEAESLIAEAVQLAKDCGLK